MIGDFLFCLRLVFLMVWVEEIDWGFGINNLLLCLLFFLHPKLNVIDPFQAAWLLFFFFFLAMDWWWQWWWLWVWLWLMVEVVVVGY